MKVQDSDLGGSLSLADTLAKGVFGDPEAQMKARLAAAQVQAHQAYATKLGADTGLVNVKTREEQALADAQDAAAAHPDALIAAVPSPAAPIPVEAPRVNAPGTTGYGPQPGIVAPDAQATYDTGVKMHDAQVATLKSLWPAIVRSGNATQVIEALGKGEGLAALSGGLVPGAKPDPNVQRVAGGLYTGAAPSTGTVWSPGDTAGQQAEAGKDIAVKGAESQLPVIKEDAGGFVRIDPKTGVATPIVGAAPKPLGGTDKGLRDQYYAELKAKKDQGQELTPTEQAALTAIEQDRLKDTTVALDPEKPIARMKPDGSGVEVVPGQPAAPTLSPFGKGDEATQKNFISTITQKFSNPDIPITAEEAQNYAQAWAGQYGTKTQVVEDNQGVKHYVPVTPETPAGLPKPADVYARAGIKIAPPAAAPSAQPPGPLGPNSAPAPAPASKPNDVVFPDSPPKLTPEAGKVQSQASAAALAEKYIAPMKPADIPNALEAKWAVDNSTGLTQSMINAYAVSPATKNWAVNAMAFTNAVNRHDSGAAITPDEWNEARKLYIPMPNDDPSTLALKREYRINKVKGMAREGYANDPAGLQKFSADLDATAAPSADPNKPANVPPEWDNLSARGRELWLKAHGGQK